MDTPPPSIVLGIFKPLLMLTVSHIVFHSARELKVFIFLAVFSSCNLFLAETWYSPDCVSLDY